MSEREDTGRQARPTVFLDETEHPQTLHEVAQIMLSCQDRPLDDDEIIDIEDERGQAQREDEYLAARHIKHTIEVARHNLKRMLPDEPFSDELATVIVRHMRLARYLARRNAKYKELEEELLSVIYEEGSAP
jgi:hypothetical protein